MAMFECPRSRWASSGVAHLVAASALMSWNRIGSPPPRSHLSRTFCQEALNPALVNGLPVRVGRMWSPPVLPLPGSFQHSSKTASSSGDISIASRFPVLDCWRWSASSRMSAQRNLMMSPWR